MISFLEMISLDLWLHLVEMVINSSFQSPWHICDRWGEAPCSSRFTIVTRVGNDHVTVLQGWKAVIIWSCKMSGSCLKYGVHIITLLWMSVSLHRSPPLWWNILKTNKEGFVCMLGILDRFFMILRNLDLVMLFGFGYVSGSGIGDIW